MFGRNGPKREKEPPPPANPRVKASIYGMAALYVLYLYYKIAAPYLTKDPYGPSTLQFVLGTVLLGGRRDCAGGAGVEDVPVRKGAAPGRGGRGALKRQKPALEGRPPALVFASVESLSGHGTVLQKAAFLKNAPSLDSKEKPHAGDDVPSLGFPAEGTVRASQ